MTAALEGVKPGDKIKVRHSVGSGFEVHEVERVTKTLAVCKHATFRIDSGVRLGTAGGGRWRKHGSFATDADFAKAAIEARLRAAQIALPRLRLSANTVALAEALIAAVEQEKLEATHAA